MPTGTAAPPISPTAMMAAIVVAVGALYVGSDVLIPLALAILLSFMLAPIVVRLRRLGLGRVPAVIAVVLLLFIALLGLGAIVANQVVNLADNLPRYEWNLRSKIRDLRIAIPSGGVVERASEMLRDLNKELKEATAPPEKEATSSAAAEPPKPIPVQIQEPPPPPLQTLRELGGPLVAPIATAGLVVVFVIFMLLQREDLRDRVTRLLGARDVARATEAIDDAGKRISRYLLMQLVINVLYGIPVGVGLYFLGVPNPILWGLLATVLRFLPYIGPVIAALFPIALSFAVAPGWTLPLLDRRAVRHARAVQQQRARALAVRLEHRALAGRDHCRRGVLDRAVGPGGAAPVDAAHRLPGRSRPPRPAARVFPRAAG